MTAAKSFPRRDHNGPLVPIGGAVYDVGKLFPRFRDIEACLGGVPIVRIVRIHNQYRASLGKELGLCKGALRLRVRYMRVAEMRTPVEFAGI
jgi:hypothetical protein